MGMVAMKVVIALTEAEFLLHKVEDAQLGHDQLDNWSG